MSDDDASASGPNDSHAADQIIPLVYDELRRLAAQKLAHEAAGQTLDATGLVHEAYLRLVGSGQARWDNRGHFFAAAAEAMRRILIENARRKQRQKHGGQLRRVDFAGDHLVTNEATDNLLEIDEAITNLATEDAAAADVVKLHLYAGLSIEEAGDALGMARASAYRDWSYARAWLRCRLQQGDNSSAG